MRRSIDSDYIRKKRTSRRPRDNWRKVKGTKKMEKDSNLLITVAALFLFWICLSAILLHMVF